MTYRLAVDLGTSYTAAAIADRREPTMVGLGNRAMQLPSVLYAKQDGSFLVGESAEWRGLNEPDRVVREFKRRLGDHVPLWIGGASYSAEALMARLLRAVVDAVASQEGAPPEAILCTHPANWGPYKLEVFQQVIALADLPGVQLATEPAAAAAQYASRTTLSVGEKIVIYDLGGGTFDVCVLEKTGDGFRLLGKPDGVEHLGGADFDEAMLALVLQPLAERTGDLDLEDASTNAGLARLRRDCVAAKEALSGEIDVVIPVSLPGLNTTVRVTRAELEAAIRPALNDTVTATIRALRSAQLQPADLKAVVLVGGSSRIPLAGELLQQQLRVPVTLDTHPKHDIALGAVRLCRPAGSEAPHEAPAVPSPSIRLTPAVPDRPNASTVLDDPDYLAAVSALYAKRWSTAVPLLQTAAQRYPDHPRIAERLRTAETQLRLEQLQANAMSAESERRWSDVVESLTGMQALGSSRDDLGPRLEAARRHVRIDELAAEIASLGRAHEWNAVLTAAEELAALDQAAVPADVVAQARHELETVELDTAYAGGLRQLDDEDWRGALATFTQLNARRSHFRDTDTLMAVADQQLHLANLYADAEAATADGQTDRAIGVWERILAIDTDYRDVGTRLAEARRVGEQQRAERSRATSPTGAPSGAPTVVGRVPAGAEAARPQTSPARPGPDRGARPSRTKSTIGFAIVVVLVIAAIVLGVALRSRSAPNDSGSSGGTSAAGTASGSASSTTSPSPSPTSPSPSPVSPSPSPSGSPSTAAERKLFDLIPTDYALTCTTRKVTDTRLQPGATAMLSCKPKGSAAPEVLEYITYKSRKELDAAVVRYTGDSDPGTWYYNSGSKKQEGNLTRLKRGNAQIEVWSMWSHLVFCRAQSTKLSEKKLDTWWVDETWIND